MYIWRYIDLFALYLLNLEELQKATAAVPSCKVAGNDGLPVDVYKQYGEKILPFLLKVLNTGKQRATLPYSLIKTNIILLLKPGHIG